MLVNHTTNRISGPLGVPLHDVDICLGLVNVIDDEGEVFLLIDNQIAHRVNQVIIRQGHFPDVVPDGDFPERANVDGIAAAFDFAFMLPVAKRHHDDGLVKDFLKLFAPNFWNKISCVSHESNLYLIRPSTIALSISFSRRSYSAGDMALISARV